MAIRTDEERSKALMHYGSGPKCKQCGQPTNALCGRCERCIEAQYHAEELGHLAQYLRERPTLIEAAHDKLKVVHLVMPKWRKVAWCGGEVTQQKDKRKLIDMHVFPGGLPEGLAPEAVCKSCLAVWEEMGL
jgi:hypothetical protein